MCKDKKYIIVSRKFDEVSASACPMVGQISTDNKLLAYLIYWYLNKYSYKHYMSICVMLMKRNEQGLYDAIKR